MMAVWVAERRNSRPSHPVCATCSPSSAREDDRFECNSRIICSLLRSTALSSRRSAYSLLKQAPANRMPQRISPNKTSSKFICARPKANSTALKNITGVRADGSLFLSIGCIDPAHRSQSPKHQSQPPREISTCGRRDLGA
jgi:hypothetical protein